MAKKLSRREMLGLGAATIAGGVALFGKDGQAKSHGGGSSPYQPASGPKSSASRAYWEKSYSGGPIDVKPLPAVLPGKGYQPVVVPNGAALPFKVVDRVKIFHLIAEELDHAFDSGLRAKCWGFNGRINSTVIEAVEGERVRIYVTNRLSVATSVHWHGIYLPAGMDGVGGLSQPYIKPGETFRYEWTLRQHGTFMYHSHHDEMTQMGMGMIGMFVIHPRTPTAEYRVERDFVMMLSEWVVEAGTARPNTVKDSGFNILTINGKVFPSTQSMICKTGDKSSHALRQSRRDGSSSDSSPWLSFSNYRHRRRRYSLVGSMAGNHGVGRGRTNSQYRIRRRRAGGLGDALPYDPSRDESDGP